MMPGVKYSVNLPEFYFVTSLRRNVIVRVPHMHQPVVPSLSPLDNMFVPLVVFSPRISAGGTDKFSYLYSS